MVEQLAPGMTSKRHAIHCQPKPVPAAVSSKSAQITLGLLSASQATVLLEGTCQDHGPDTRSGARRHYAEIPEQWWSRIAF